MFIHGNNYIHRDIKTHNVLVTSGVGGYVAKIADFGTALHISKGRKLTESVGTLGYTAPEVISQHPSYDTSADIFSLAILMWDTLQPRDGRLENPLTCLSPEEAPDKVLPPSPAFPHRSMFFVPLSLSPPLPANRTADEPRPSSLSLTLSPPKNPSVD
jgi:serine/threonine protein kinase